MAKSSLLLRSKRARTRPNQVESSLTEDGSVSNIKIMCPRDMAAELRRVFLYQEIPV